MGMGIAFFRFAMGGPAGMADAAMARGTLLFPTGGQVQQLALGLEAMQSPLGSPARIRQGLHRGDAGGVITAVFELSQPLQQLGRSLSRTDQGNDAAHGGRGAPHTKKPGAGRA